jgi:hypothetical protein
MLIFYFFLIIDYIDFVDNTGKYKIWKNVLLINQIANSLAFNIINITYIII